jgi:hypothetical protein
MVIFPQIFSWVYIVLHMSIILHWTEKVLFFVDLNRTKLKNLINLITRRFTMLLIMSTFGVTYMIIVLIKIFALPDSRAATIILLIVYVLMHGLYFIVSAVSVIVSVSLKLYHFVQNQKGKVKERTAYDSIFMNTLEQETNWILIMGVFNIICEGGLLLFVLGALCPYDPTTSMEIRIAEISTFGMCMILMMHSAVTKNYLNKQYLGLASGKESLGNTLF